DGGVRHIEQRVIGGLGGVLVGDGRRGRALGGGLDGDGLDGLDVAHRRLAVRRPRGGLLAGRFRDRLGGGRFHGRLCHRLGRRALGCCSCWSCLGLCFCCTLRCHN